MNVHHNARMTVHGRLLLIQRVREAGWRVVDAAAAAGVSERTAYTWLARYRAGGERALHDRSSAPSRSPHRLPAETVAAIERLRRQRWSGPRIACALGRPVSTVGTVLRRLGLGRLSVLAAKPPAIRYERRTAGELLHIDSKKLGRIAGFATGSPATAASGRAGSAGNTCTWRSTTPRAWPTRRSCPTNAARAARASSPAPPPGSPGLAFGSSGS
jgi:transposase